MAASDRDCFQWDKGGTKWGKVGDGAFLCPDYGEGPGLHALDLTAHPCYCVLVSPLPTSVLFSQVLGICPKEVFLF